MEPKNILITGCSSGIGKNAAITLHNKGWRVFATCRSKNDCNFLKIWELKVLNWIYKEKNRLITL